MGKMDGYELDRLNACTKDLVWKEQKEYDPMEHKSFYSALWERENKPRLNIAISMAMMYIEDLTRWIRDEDLARYVHSLKSFEKWMQIIARMFFFSLLRFSPKKHTIYYLEAIAYKKIV